MPYDVLKLSSNIDHIRNAFEQILAQSGQRQKYSAFWENLNALAGFLQQFSKLDAYGNYAKIEKEQISAYKNACRIVMREAAAMIPAPDTKQASIQLADAAGQLLPILESDLAILDIVDITEPLSLPEMLEQGRTGVVETDADLKIPESGVTLQVEHAEDKVIETGLFVKKADTVSCRLATALGKQELVQKTMPMVVSNGENEQKGVFISKVPGFCLKDAKPGDPELLYGARQMNNPAVLGDIASAQVMDHILGIGRGPEGFALRFSKDKNPVLTGITLLSEPGKGEVPAAEDLCIIPESLYQSLQNLEEGAFHALTAAAGLAKDKSSAAWEKREALLKKIESDRDFFADRQEGYIERGKIRVIPDEKLNLYDEKALSKTQQTGYFALIERIPEFAKNQASAANEDTKETIRGRFAGNGLMQKRQVSEPDTLRLAVPPLCDVKKLGNELSTRYAVKYYDEKGVKKGFFTPAKEYSLEMRVKEIFEKAIETDPQYKEILTDLKDYFVGDKDSSAYFRDGFWRGNVSVPYKEIGYSEQEANRYRNDTDFYRVWSRVQDRIAEAAKWEAFYTAKGFTQGQRIELKNVAMSEVGDLLGVPNLLARSVPCQIGSDGHIVDGVFMENAQGLDIQNLSTSHPVFFVEPEKISKMFNTKSGLKSLADLQILDYICMNTDRHGKNMLYQFADLDTDEPKFIGVMGIDNDLSFGEEVPLSQHGQAHLPALDNMKVISEEMIKQLESPGFYDRLEETLKKRGLKDAEIVAAKQRINMVREAVDSGRLRIVKKEEWGQGQNTLEALAVSKKAETTYFDRVRLGIKVIVESQWRNNHELLKNGRTIPPYQPKDRVRFTAAKQVDAFGENLLLDQEMQKLTKQAHQEYMEKIRRTIQNAPDKVKLIKDADAMEQIHITAKNMYWYLDSVDPTFMWSSPAFRELKKTCKEMISLAEKLQKKAAGTENKWLGDKDRSLMEKKLYALRDSVAAYHYKKQEDIRKEKRDYKDIEILRMQASTKVSELTAGLEKTLKASGLHSPMEWLRFRMAHAQGRISTETGQPLLKRVAEILYYRSLSEAALKTKKSAQMLNTLTNEQVAKGTKEVMEDPAFKNIAKLPEKELRRLASQRSVAELMKHFKAALVQEKKSQKSVDIVRGK